MTDHKTWEAVWLGIVQGITEFLPISSDGHLSVVHALYRNGSGTEPGEDPIELFLVLHLGTLLAILGVYWREVYELRKQPRLCGLIALTILPLVFVAIPLEKFFDSMLKNPMAAGVGFLITAMFLIIAEQSESGRYGLSELKPWHALVIGLFQTLAPLPGVSRSGTTIGGGLFLGVRRDAATTFSFLIAIPAVGGACVWKLKGLFSGTPRTEDAWPLFWGGLTSFVVGWFCLKWMIRIVNRGKLRWFAAYLIVVGIATILWQLSLAHRN